MVVRIMCNKIGCFNEFVLKEQRHKHVSIMYTVHLVNGYFTVAKISVTIMLIRVELAGQIFTDIRKHKNIFDTYNLSASV